MRGFHKADKPFAANCHGLQVLVATPEVNKGKRVAGLFTRRPELEVTGATYVRIGGKDALRDGNLVRVEGWTALAAFIREYLGVLGTEIVHHPIGAGRVAAE